MKKHYLPLLLTLFSLVSALNSNAQCTGTGTDAREGTFAIGYEYSFETSGTDVTVTFKLLDTDKVGVVAFLQEESPFKETQMALVEGTTFSVTLANQSFGSSIGLSCKFAYAGGLATTDYISYSVGDNCQALDPAKDVSLSDLTVDGTTITGFASQKTTYTIDLTSGTTVVPTIAVATTQAGATSTVTPAASLPGTTSVLVTSSDMSAMATYTIAFVFSSPQTAALTPIPRNAADVVSIFSDAYTDVSGSDFNPNWGQATVQSIEQVAGNSTLKYANFNYQGITIGSVIDVSAMTHLHVDVWTTGTQIGIVPVSQSAPREFPNTKTVDTRTWNSLNIEVSEFSSKGLTLNDLNEFKFDQGSGETVFIDNIYFYKGETTSDPTAPTGTYCELVTKDNNNTPDSEVKLTIKNTGALELTIEIESNDNNAVNLLLVEQAGEASRSASNADGKYTMVLTYSDPAPASLATLRLLWGKENVGGNRQLDLTNIPFTTSCTFPSKVVATNETSTADMTVGDLTVNAGMTLTVAAGHTLYVNGDMTLNGNLIVNSGASLITYDGKVTGDVTIKRNTRYSDGKYSFVGSPVEAKSTITGANLGSIVYWYDETVAYGSDGIARWKDASSMQLTAGWGYAQANQKEVSFTGVPNDGTITVTGLSHTALDSKHDEHGWSLLSNPYPAAISVTKFLANTTNAAALNGSVYLWDDHGSESGRGDNGDYLTANSLGDVGGPNGGIFNGYLGSMQGFFVKVASPTASASVEFTESMRVGGVNADATFFRKDNVAPLNIKLALETKSGFYNELLVGLRENATIGVDRSYDAAKLISNQDLQFYSLIDNNKFAIQGLPLLDGVATELAFNLAESSEVTLFVNELTGLAEGASIILTDRVTGKSYDLSETNSITFSAEAGTDQNRFSLSYSAAAILGNDNVMTQPIYRYFNNELSVNFGSSLSVQGYAVYDMTGRLISQADMKGELRSELMIPVTNQGINVIRIMTTEGTFIRKFLF